MSSGLPKPVRARIAVGANLGDRRGQIERAVRALRQTPGVHVVSVSELIRTRAVTLPDAPPQPSFLNGAVVIETTLTCRQLLDRLMELERQAGRDRGGEEKWAARPLDLDLLLYGDEVIEEDGLTVPHPRMHERDFVLAPLSLIDPDATHPLLKRTIRDLLNGLPAKQWDPELLESSEEEA